MSDKLKLSASERINTLLDDSSFVEIGSGVTARVTDFNESPAATPKDGVITGYGLINGRLVYVYSQDVSVLGGSVGEMHAKKILAVYRMAVKCGAPVIGLIDTAGIRLQEATDALHYFGTLFKKYTMASGVIPQITAVFGNCGGGAGILAAMSDFTYMTEGAKLFVNSPNALKDNYEEKLDTSSAAYLSEETSLVDNVFASDSELIARLRELFEVLPSNNEEIAIDTCADDLNRTIPGIDAMADDGREVARAISDDNLFIETKAKYASDVVTGYIKLNGATVGVVANQVKDGGDYMSGLGADKAAALVNFCDAFNIPVLTITNVKGFKTTVADEKTLATDMAKLTGAFVNATVPKVNVITGTAYGSAYTVMNSKALGADIVYAWPGAKIGIMDSSKAAEIIYSEDIAAAGDKIAAINEAAAKIDELSNSAESAARRGYVDDIIEPDATRKRVIAALEMLSTKSEMRPNKKHLSI